MKFTATWRGDGYQPFEYWFKDEDKGRVKMAEVKADPRVRQVEEVQG